MNPSQISLRTVFTVCFGVLIVVVVTYAAFKTRVAITLTLLAAMLAVALDHAVARLQRWRLPRWLAILVVGLLLLGLGGLVAALVIPTAVAQSAVLAQSVPTLVENIRNTHTFEVLNARFGINEAIDRLGKDAPNLIFSAVNAVVGAIFATVAVVLLAVFMLIFGAPLISRLLHEIDRDQRRRLRDILARIYRLLGGYVAGIILIAACNAILTTTFLAILGMPFFVALAILSGLATMVPYVGSLVTSATISILALASLGFWPAIACVVFFVTLGQIEGNILGPLIFRRTANVNPLVTLLAILFFGAMSGIVGAFLAIPFVGVLHIVAREILAFRRGESSPSAGSAALSGPSALQPPANGPRDQEQHDLPDGGDEDQARDAGEPPSPGR